MERDPIPTGDQSDPQSIKASSFPVDQKSGLIPKDLLDNCEKKDHTSINQLLDEDMSHMIPEGKLHRFSIAPMMDITNVHFRFLMRLLTRYSTLWTEMIHSNALRHNQEQREGHLRFNRIEHPVVLQLGGNDPATLTIAGLLGEKEGYDEININCGCPSEKVQSGCFGAVLMKEPKKVAECVKAMRESMKIEAHVKCRIGVDDDDSYEFVKDFVEIVWKEGGCSHFIIHSRKCILQGLNPHENRTVPPLKYEVVKQLKKDFPLVQFSINGGIKTYEQIEEFLNPEFNLTGVMVGRLAYENPWILSDVDRRVYGLPNQKRSRKELLAIYAEYGDREVEKNPKLAWPTLMKPIINLFYNEPHSAVYRRLLSDRELYKKVKKYSEVVLHAVEELEKLNPQAVNARPPSSE